MNIGLLGCGVVGGGILDFCAERADLTVAKVLVRRPRPELGTLAVTDIADITGDPPSASSLRSWAACTRPMNIFAQSALG